MDTITTVTLESGVPGLLLKGAFLCFVLNFVFGLLVRTGIIDSRRFRFVHTALYFCAVTSLAIAALAYWTFGPSIGAVACGVMLLLLLVMSRLPGRLRGHWIYAIICAAMYIGLMVMMNHFDSSTTWTS